jgi:hypothetical protein
MNNAPNTSALNGHVASFATSSMDFFFLLFQGNDLFIYFLNNALDTSALNGHGASFATSSMDFSYCFKEMGFFFFFACS